MPHRAQSTTSVGGSPRGLLKVKEHLFPCPRLSLHCPNRSTLTCMNNFAGAIQGGPRKADQGQKGGLDICGANPTNTNPFLTLTLLPPQSPPPFPLPFSHFSFNQERIQHQALIPYLGLHGAHLSNDIMCLVGRTGRSLFLSHVKSTAGTGSVFIGPVSLGVC